jgi:hypothetical protein
MPGIERLGEVPGAIGRVSPGNENFVLPVGVASEPCPCSFSYR